jgi:nucleotide-binding universal stress UspA family protein
VESTFFITGNKPPVDPATGKFSLRTILVPVDFSACAAEGAQYAAEFAGATGADLLLLHVMEPPSLMAADLVAQPHVWPQVEREAFDRCRRQARRAAEFARDRRPRGGDKGDVGIAAAEIARETEREDVEMVITSTHGRSGLRHLLLGSTANS